MGCLLLNEGTVVSDGGSFKADVLLEGSAITGIHPVINAPRSYPMQVITGHSNPDTEKPVSDDTKRCNTPDVYVTMSRLRTGSAAKTPASSDAGTAIQKSDKQ